MRRRREEKLCGNPAALSFSLPPPSALLHRAMPLNIPGILVPFQAIFQPKILLPSLIVKGTTSCSHTVSARQLNTYRSQDLRCLDFPALHRAGYRGAVFDKDNCLVRQTLFSIRNSFRIEDRHYQARILSYQTSPMLGMSAGECSAQRTSSS